jgi:hypothetical protein
MHRLPKLALLAVSALALAVAVPALADYLGPARHVIDLIEVRDPSSDYWTCHHAAYSQPCILHHPDNPCPDCGGSHPSKEQQSYWCGWPSGDFSGYLGCGCTAAYTYQQVEYDLPEATIAGDLLNCVAGSGGWCLSSPTLHLTADEPLTGYAILAIEGSRGADPFACPGSVCDVPLTEGENAFTYWALSSYGDSSRMGSLTAWVDTVPPTSAFTSPAEGSQVWASGDLGLAGSSADATSGLAGTELSFDGGATWTSPALSPDGTWSYVWDTHMVGDGTYPLQARAWDVAGNLGASAQVTVLVDNTGPLVDIPDRWNIWDEAPLVVDDGGIGLAGVRVTILGGEYGSRTYDYSPGTLPGAVVWDRRFAAPGDPPGTFSILAPIGEYEVAVQAWDHQGNQASDTGVLVIPSPGAAPPETAASAAAVLPPTATPTIRRIQAATITPARTATPLAVAALPLVEQGAAGPAAASAPAATTGGSNLPLWGAAALALAAGATAYALSRRREREAEHEAELDRKREQAAEWAAKATALKARVEANKQTARSAAAVVAAAAAVAADVARRFADRRVERLEERLHAQEVQAQERARLEAARQAEEAARAAALAQAERLRAIAEARDEPADAGSVDLVPVPSFLSSPVGWFEATLVNAGRQDAQTRDRLTRTLTPMVDPLLSIADHERNPVTASFHDAAWARIHALEERRRDYMSTANEAGMALRDRRWGDALGGLGHLAELHFQSLRDSVSMQWGMVWGFVTTPLRLVTRSAPAFVTAVSERMRGRDRGWDVLFTGTMLEADVLGSYYVAQPTGLVDRANLAVDRHLFGSLETGVPSEFLPPSLTGQWRNWALPSGVTTLDQAYIRQAAPTLRIDTPFGVATQELSDPALRLRSEVAGGRPLFRGGTIGRSATGEGQFWAPESPLSPEYASRYGVASFTEPDFVIEGTLREGTQFVTRTAPAVGSNPGGALEVVTEPNGVRVDSFHMPDP